MEGGSVRHIFKGILKSKRGTKDMYLLLIRNNIVSNGQKKWEEILALGLDETKWREIFKLPFIVTQNTKLQWLRCMDLHVGQKPPSLLPDLSPLLMKIIS
jgi:hypothetical protein